MRMTLPYLLTISELRAGNIIRQMGESSVKLDGKLGTYSNGRLHGHLFQPIGTGDEVLIIPKANQTPVGFARIIQASFDATADSCDISKGLWLKHPLLDHHSAEFNYQNEIESVRESWDGAFSYIQEDPAHNIIGLRSPQIGAIHAVHAHWSVSEAPATIVMPTGTGKTDTMISILVSAGCRKLLVVVPTDALRSQLAEKFFSLGILKSPGCAVLRAGVKQPIVCTLLHIPRSVEEVDEIFGRSQVIITTSSIAGQCGHTVQVRMAQNCPYLFIDEAHHIEAATWSAFKEKFREQKILQFTATPFREDGKPLDGEIIFKYPLKKAQQEGYFKPIRFQPVIEFNPNRSDKAIASAAIEQLRADQGKNHILMARVGDVARAERVFDLYAPYKEFNPVQLHTGIKSLKERAAIREKIIRGESRIVVCVDMLGEGFDLPELKIAAFHDIRKTLAVTLQLAGRFTRVRPDLGDATFIANIADIIVQEELRKLYARDPDWNALLPELSERMIGEQVSLQEFLKGFTEFTKEIPLKTVRPAMSTVVYRTTCRDWAPERFRTGIPGLSTCEQVYEAINHARKTLVIVTARRASLVWSDLESLFSWEWELYIVIWDADLNLLFINSSTNAGEYKALAHAIVGDTATLIKGRDVFRALAGIKRLRLQNVGLTEQLGRNLRYTGRMGADVAPVVPEVQLRRAWKSVASGSGYEDGSKTTIGASRKGRIWSHRRDRIGKLVEWCKKIGIKLLDSTIDPDEILRGTLEAKPITERPRKMPISIDWPEEMYTTLEAFWSIVIDDHEYFLSELSIDLMALSIEGALRFLITSERDQAELELQLFEEKEIQDYRFVIRSGKRVSVRHSGSAIAENATDFFYDHPPAIWFSDGSVLEGNQYIELKDVKPPYDSAKIQAWNWTGVDIRKESQGNAKEPDSIQAKVISELRNRDFDMIVDDDGKGEAADIVAIHIRGDKATPSCIDIEFYHCKYSGDDTPGRRIKDLYELCGQAQKSIYWMSTPEKRTDLFTHLMRREARRRESGGSSRYEVGNGELLQTIREMSFICPLSLTIYVVQPGLSKSKATRDQLEILSVTETYLMETYQLSFGVIGNA